MTTRIYKGQPPRRVSMPKTWRRIEKPASARRRAARRLMAAAAAVLLIVGAWSPNAMAWQRHGSSDDGYGGSHHAPSAEHYDGGGRRDRGGR